MQILLTNPNGKILHKILSSQIQESIPTKYLSNILSTGKMFNKVSSWQSGWEKKKDTYSHHLLLTTY